MSTIFTKIIQGEIPSYKVAENDHFIAFLDINPNAKGHILCVPKIEVDQVFDLDETTYLNLMRFSRKIAKALKKSVPCKRIGMAIIGLEVAHVHVHLIPLNEMREMTFSHKIEMTQDEFIALATEIRNNL